MLDIKQKFNLLNKITFSKGEISAVLEKFSNEYTLYDLINKGVLAVIKRDESYLNLCYETKYTPRVLGATYCNDTSYMFGGLAVYNLYGFTTQLANQYLIFSDRFYGTKKIHTIEIAFKKVKNELIYGYEQNFDRGIYYKIMTKERAFIEFCRDNKEKNTELKEIYKTMIDKSELKKLLKKYPYQNVRDFISSDVIGGVS